MIAARRGSPRVNKFRNLVKTASTAMACSEDEEVDVDITNKESRGKVKNARNTEKEQNDESEAEEGETMSSEEDENDYGSDSSSVKILPRSQEEIDREEAEYKAASDRIVNQAVDKTFEKLAEFMKQSGIIFQQPHLVNDAEEVNTGKHKGKGKGKKSNNTKPQLIICNTSSGTTIYDNAIMPARSATETEKMRVEKGK